MAASDLWLSHGLYLCCEHRSWTEFSLFFLFSQFAMLPAFLAFCIRVCRSLNYFCSSLSRESNAAAVKGSTKSVVTFVKFAISKAFAAKDASPGAT